MDSRVMGLNIRSHGVDFLSSETYTDQAVDAPHVHRGVQYRASQCMKDGCRELHYIPLFIYLRGE